jgi:hypothetical protein
MDDREAAWGALRRSCLSAGAPARRKSTRRRIYERSSQSPKQGGRHGPPPASVSGFGVDEASAVRDLTDRLAT